MAGEGAGKSAAKIRGAGGSAAKTRGAGGSAGKGAARGVVSLESSPTIFWIAPSVAGRPGRNASFLGKRLLHFVGTNGWTFVWSLADIACRLWNFQGHFAKERNPCNF